MARVATIIILILIFAACAFLVLRLIGLLLGLILEGTDTATPPATGRSRNGLIAIALVVLVVLYFTGSLDTFLYKFHLNYHKCAQNGYGAVFCGKALEEYEGNYDRATDYGNLP